MIVLNLKFSYGLSLAYIFILLVFMLWSSNFWVFYFSYEIIFILIIFSILILGYSYERLFALYIIIVYSFIFSSPCLAIFFLIDNVFLIKNWLSYDILFIFFILFSFMVKFPIFGFHYWLPIAHVEASTLGRILLAGILLKIGGIGIYYLVNYLAMIVKFHWLLWGISLIILLILNLRDLKSIIAYSSIAHITLVFYVLNLGGWMAKKGVLIIIFYHGFISPLMFWIVGALRWWKTRSLLVLKYISFSYFFILIVFFIVLINIGFPPFIGFVTEILIFKSIVNLHYYLIIALLTVLFRCYYNIYYFWSFTISQGWVVKFRVRYLDVYLFIFFVIFLNFY